MDPFEYMPPYPTGEAGFIELLRQHQPFVPKWSDRSAKEAEVDLRIKIDFSSEFPDNGHLLDTVLAAFERFCGEAGIDGGSFPVRLIRNAALTGEEFQVDISVNAVIIAAGETEGARRALYFFMSEISASPVFKCGIINRKPWLKNRISRCFFGPIKRPPFYIDELTNDIDYYPDEYLNELASEGINGLWLTINFSDISSVSIRPDDPFRMQRIVKLRKTVDKCRRYGIKIWVFCIEPLGWSHAWKNTLPEGCEILKGPGERCSEPGEEVFSFCPDSAAGQEYLYQAVNSVFSSVPDLGGMIVVSHGERTTSCLSLLDSHGDGKNPCHRYCGKSVGEIFSSLITPMKKGMTDAAPDAELISWIYMPHVDQCSNWITQIPEKLNYEAIMAFNFESGVSRYQAGKVRVGGDYWLSESGPADRFVMMSMAAKNHCDMAAKIQTANCHECATVPEIPVPQLLYRKYRQMHTLGVKNVIMCWYFGNYPGVMNKVSGRLAYHDFSVSEEEFLLGFAETIYGKYAKHAFAAWQNFTEAYSNYPLDCMFQYYGPIHDGVVWPLYLQYRHLPLTRSWKPESFPAGDAVGECMRHFELTELVTQSAKLSRQWKCGMKEFRKLPEKIFPSEYTLVQALDIMFESAANILRFYALRSAIADGAADGAILLKKMRQIAVAERENSLKMAELCKADPRLGYHSEAEVYKFFPEKLAWRAETVSQLLENEFVSAEKLADSPEKLAEFICNRPSDAAVSGKWYGSNGIKWYFTYDAENIYFKFNFADTAKLPETAYVFLADAKSEKQPVISFSVSKTGKMEKNGCWQTELIVPREVINYASIFRFGVERVFEDPVNGKRYVNDCIGEFQHDLRLYLGFFSADKLREIRL